MLQQQQQNKQIFLLAVGLVWNEIIDQLIPDGTDLISLVQIERKFIKYLVYWLMGIYLHFM